MSLTGPERSYPRARVNSTYLICIDRESTTLMALLFFFSSFSSITPTGVLSTLYHVICVFNHIFDKYSRLQPKNNNFSPRHEAGRQPRIGFTETSAARCSAFGYGECCQPTMTSRLAEYFDIPEDSSQENDAITWLHSRGN
jgi:hypothetical protein